MSNENNLIDEVKNLVIEIKQGMESKISSLETQNKELSSKLESVASVSQQVEAVSKDVSAYKKTQEELDAQVKTHDKTLENLAANKDAQGVVNASYKSINAKEYKDFQRALYNADEKNPLVITPENFGNIAYNHKVTSSKSLIATYNLGLEPTPRMQPFVDDTNFKVGNKVLRYCSVDNAGSQLSKYHFPFVNRNLISVYGRGETRDLSPTGKPTFNHSYVELESFTAIYPEISGKQYEQMQNGDLPFDTMAYMQSALQLSVDEWFADKAFNGSGSNSPLGLLTDFNKNGTEAGYNKVEVTNQGDLEKIETYIKLVRSADRKVVAEGGTWVMFMTLDALEQLITATGAAEQAPNRNDARFSFSDQGGNMVLRHGMGFNIIIEALEPEYGLSIASSKISAVLGRFSDYHVVRSSLVKQFVEKTPKQDEYTIQMIGYGGGAPVRKRAFSFLVNNF